MPPAEKTIYCHTAALVGQRGNLRARFTEDARCVTRARVDVSTVREFKRDGVNKGGRVFMIGVVWRFASSGHVWVRRPLVRYVFSHVFYR